jgi:hypothetical protein
MDTVLFVRQVPLIAQPQAPLDAPPHVEEPPPKPEQKQAEIIAQMTHKEAAVKRSGVAVALAAVAVIELIASPFEGLAVGSGNAPVGWLVFVGGVISGLILLGFAELIELSHESAELLRDIKIRLLLSDHDDKLLKAFDKQLKAREDSRK